MNVTGYQIREAIRLWTLKRDALATQFKDSQYFFEGERKSSPEEVADAFARADRALARLQTAQDAFNLGVMVRVHDLGSITLAEAIKAVGGYARLEKMWRGAAGALRERRDYYDEARERVRRKDEEQAARAISQSGALERATNAAVTAGALRSAIGVANSRSVEIDVDPALLG